VTDLAISPFHDKLLATGSEGNADASIKLWKVSLKTNDDMKPGDASETLTDHTGNICQLEWH